MFSKLKITAFIRFTLKVNCTDTLKFFNEHVNVVLWRRMEDEAAVVRSLQWGRSTNHESVSAVNDISLNVLNVSN